jgi:hypothetical protein
LRRRLFTDQVLQALHGKPLIVDQGRDPATSAWACSRAIS